MPHENVELAYGTFDAFNRRDLDAFLGLMAENVRAEPWLGGVEGGYAGHEGIRRWWTNLLDWIPDLAFEVMEVRELGDELILVILHTWGHGAKRDEQFERTTWMPARIRDGKCVWWGSFATAEEALEAAGLSE